MTAHTVHHFHVNQQPVVFAGDAQAPLLSVLRDELALSGPKFGCGQGECGACMVLVDGQPQTSCNLPVWAVQGKAITTLEGLGTPGQPHPLQTAFIHTRAAQCGYCVAGIVTSAAALLAEHPRPTRLQIVQALDRHLCRCGAHNRMVHAVQCAAAAGCPPGAGHNGNQGNSGGNSGGHNGGSNGSDYGAANRTTTHQPLAPTTAP